MVRVQIQVSVSVNGFSMHSNLYRLAGVWGVLRVKEGDASFLFWVPHGKLYMVIYLVSVIKYNVHMYFLVMQMISSTDLFHQGVGMGHWGPSASHSKYSISMFAITGDTGNPSLLLEAFHRTYTGMRIFKNTKVQIIFKGCNTLKTY